MKVFLINMDKDTERLARMKIRLKGKEYERITGVPHETGYIGCALSHHKCWQRIIDDNLEMALILEDDAIIGPDVFEVTIPPCDLYFIGYDNFNWSNFEKICGTHCYVVTNSGAKKLLDMKLNDHIDTLITQNKQLLTSVHVKSLSNQECLDSNIAKIDMNNLLELLLDTYKLGWIRYSNMILVMFIIAGVLKIPLIIFTTTPKLWVAFFMGLLVNVYAKSFSAFSS
jgi:GR25 family glycosyltransferase involved in LPS biosynthesis